MDDLYQEHILQHYRQPLHYGELERPSVTTPAANPSCGDDIVIDLKLDEQGIITNLAWRGNGCALSKASASMLADWAIGKKLAQVQQLSDQQVQEIVHIPDLSLSRVKCATLFVRALQHINNLEQGKQS